MEADIDTIHHWLRLRYTHHYRQCVYFSQCASLASSFNKYISIAGRATVQALKEEPRVNAERRITEMGLRYQTWQNGKASEQTYVKPPTETH
ncbi:hypothetical protein P389DRAFT_144429 [Cystobasidium minutum MCA 4210]|uniref:uncharacterized protein n=1 Tax=Cystobasidium minutum MCA 4210 TaxID=1397322 RepID=UPI0034CE0951|eukprot:jgi/Rhomi1/144429/e_gw1.4.127.1